MIKWVCEKFVLLLSLKLSKESNFTHEKVKQVWCHSTSEYVNEAW